MKKSGQQIMEETSREAREVFQANADTIVAGFLVRHPDVDPSDIRLIYEIIGSTMRFRVEYLPLHVPPTKPLDVAVDSMYVAGWNAARQWVLDQAKSAIAPDGLVITLAEVREMGGEARAVEPATEETPTPETASTASVVLEDFTSNLRKAVFDRESLTLGGGAYTPWELSVLLQAIEARNE